MLTPETTVTISDLTIASLSHNQAFNWDECMLKFSLDADIRGIFNWNVKAVYAYLEMEYGLGSKVTFWDKVILRGETGIVSVENEMAKYLIRTNNQLFGEKVKIRLRLDITPIFGMHSRVDSQALHFQLPLNEV